MSTFAVKFVYFILILSICSLHQTTAHANIPNLGSHSNSSTLTQEKNAGLCTKRDISIAQMQIGVWRGIPQFAVEITNTCMWPGCQPRKIHFHCGLFASTRIVPHKKFRRLADDDCLVNNGAPLRPGQCIRFVYSNSFKYNIAFRRARFS